MLRLGPGVLWRGWGLGQLVRGSHAPWGSRGPVVAALRWSSSPASANRTREAQLQTLVQQSINPSTIGAAVDEIRRDREWLIIYADREAFSTRQFSKTIKLWYLQQFFAPILSGGCRTFQPNEPLLEDIRQAILEQARTALAEYPASQELPPEFTRCFEGASQRWNARPRLLYPAELIARDQLVAEAPNLSTEQTPLAAEQDTCTGRHHNHASHSSRDNLETMLLRQVQAHVLAWIHTDDKVVRARRQSTTDNQARFAFPHLTYPEARKCRRRIIIHRGPTNSGKTYGAMQAAAAAKTAMFCAPLRLLAWEQYERLRNGHQRAELLTGQEMYTCADATHLACTVEMTDFSRHYDVAVIDECQNIGSAERGWAWTNAILGARADVLYLIEDGSATQLLQNIAKVCGDDVEVIDHQRLAPLHVQREPLINFSHLREGDCLIGFNRRELFNLKAQAEAATGLKCAVVYGALPPDVRKAQATLFNDPHSDYKLLAASDAIGMGLNFDIGRVIFSTVWKFDGTQRRVLRPTELRQIAGRAGRYGSRYAVGGEVLAMSESDTEVLQRALDPALQLPLVEKAGLSVDAAMLMRWYAMECAKPAHRQRRRAHNVAFALAEVRHLLKPGRLYTMQAEREEMAVARLLDTIPDVDFHVKAHLCAAPLNADSTLQPLYFAYFVSCIRDELQIPPILPRNVRKEGFPIAYTAVDLKLLEEIHEVLDLCLWVGQRHGCIDVPRVEEQRRSLAEAISASLLRLAQQSQAAAAAARARRAQLEQAEPPVTGTSDDRTDPEPPVQSQPPVPNPDDSDPRSILPARDLGRSAVERLYQTILQRGQSLYRSALRIGGDDSNSRSATARRKHKSRRPQNDKSDYRDPKQKQHKIADGGHRSATAKREKQHHKMKKRTQSDGFAKRHPRQADW